MNLLQLEYFYKIAHSSTLTKAASELHISQPSLSKMIRNLETEFKVKLFYQEGRYIHLNEYGKIFLHYTTEILNSVEELKESMSEVRQRKDMELTLGVFAASTIMPEIITDFKQKYPNVKINMFLQKYENTNRKNPLDLWISSKSNSEMSDGSFLLAKEYIRLAVPRSHPLAARDTIDLSELKNEPLISMSEGKTLRKIMDEYCNQAGVVLNSVLESDDPAMIRNLIAAGFGIAFVPEKTWMQYISGDIKLLAITNLDCIRYIYYALPVDGYQSTASRLFQIHMKEYFKKITHSQYK